MQCARVDGERQIARCIRFLKEKGARNLYLYEGLVSKNTGHARLLFTRMGGAAGIAFTRNGTHLHLFLPDGCAADAARETKDLLRRRFPMLKSCFGDRGGVEKFLDACGPAVKRTRSFVFMELEKGRRGSTAPPVGGLHPAVAGKPEMAEALASLQIQYEIEELGASRDAIDRDRTLAGLRARLARGEVTLAFEGGLLVACAGVNARFERTCQIGSVYVIPARRNRGYGHSVVSAHVGRMLERYDRLALFAGETNSAARRIYGKLGFRESGGLLFAELGPLNP
jgi:predicted GNAT family acetyltransferase